MKNFILMPLLLLLESQILFGQHPISVDAYEEMRFVGYNNGNPVFKNEEKILFELNEENFKLNFLDSGKLKSFLDRYVGALEFSNDQVRYAETFAVPFKIFVRKGENIYKQEINLEFEGVSSDFKNHKVYISKENSNPNLHLSFPLRILNMETGEINKLPIKGVRPTVIGGYLYYADYPNPQQFDLVYDIYRVKIGDWKNTEKVFQDNYMNGWKISVDGKYLLAELIESGHKPLKVIYSIEDKKYVPIEAEELPSAVFFSESKNAFCFYNIGLENDNRRFVYIDIPGKFTHTPSWAMYFGDSFINTYLLEDAPEEELRELDKSQLRLLRNAIFARKGWRFQSEDLSAFFNQFSWYREQMTKVENNKEIKLTNIDKYRSQLILGIEQEK